MATKEQKVLRSFPVPTHFKNLLTTVVINHPNYKNTTDFIIQCLRYGLDEIRIDLGEMAPHEQAVILSKNKLSENITNELKDFLQNNSIEDLLNKTDCEAGISWNMNKNEFLLLKSKIPLSKYKELRVFYFHQIYNGLKRML